MHIYLFLIMAIASEVAATTALKASEGFTRWIPVIVVVIGYGLSFYFLGLVLKVIPVGVAYTIWAGLGIVLVTIAGAVMYKQIPDWPAIIGMVLIFAGVLTINLFSKHGGHE